MKTWLRKLKEFIMGLHDVDKNSDKRGNPQLNQNDQILHRMANATTSVHPVTDSTTTSGYLQTSNGRILGNDGTNNVGLFGFDDNGNMVVKVAKAGYDANSAADANLIFNSSQNVFKIVVTGTATLAGKNMTAGETKTTTVAHGLSTTPASVVYVNAPSILGLQGGNGLTAVPLIYANVGTIGVLIQSRVDSTNLYLDLINVGATTVDYSAYTWTFKYYLLQETAT